MSRLWVLVEWMDSSPAMVDVVCISPMMQRNLQISPNQIIVVRSKRGSQPRMAQVVEISSDREHLLNKKRQIDSNQDGVHCIDSTPEPRREGPFQQVDIDEDFDEEHGEENVEDIYGPNARPSTSGLASGAQSNDRSSALTAPQRIVDESSNNLSVEIQQRILSRPIMRARRPEISGNSSSNSALNRFDSTPGPSNLPIRPYPIYGAPFNGSMRLFETPRGYQSSLHRSSRSQANEHTDSTHRERRRRSRHSRSLQNIQQIQQLYVNRTPSEDNEVAQNVNTDSREQANSQRNLLVVPPEEQLVIGDGSADRDVPNSQDNRLSRYNVQNRFEDEHRELPNALQTVQVLANRGGDDMDAEHTRQNRAGISQTHQMSIRSSHTIRVDGFEANLQNEVDTGLRSQHYVSSFERFRGGSGLTNSSQSEQNVSRSSAGQSNIPIQEGSREVATHSGALNLPGNPQVFEEEISGNSEVEFYSRRPRGTSRRNAAIHRVRTELLGQYRSLQHISSRPEGYDGSNETDDQELVDESRREHFQRRRTRRPCPTCGQNIQSHSSRHLTHQGLRDHNHEDATDLQNEISHINCATHTSNATIRNNAVNRNNAIPLIHSNITITSQSNTTAQSDINVPTTSNQSIEDPPNHSNVPNRSARVYRERRIRSTGRNSLLNARPGQQNRSESRTRDERNRSMRTHSAHRDSRGQPQLNRSLQNNVRRQQASVHADNIVETPRNRLNRLSRAHNVQRERSSGRSNILNTFQEQLVDNPQRSRLESYRSRSAHSEHPIETHQNNSRENSNQAQETHIFIAPRERNVDRNNTRRSRLDSYRSRSALSERRTRTHRNSTLENVNQAQETHVLNEPSEINDDGNNTQRIRLESYRSRSAHSEQRNSSRENEDQAQETHTFKTPFERSNDENPTHSSEEGRNTNNQSLENKLNSSQAREVAEEDNELNDQNYFASIGLDQHEINKKAKLAHEKRQEPQEHRNLESTLREHQPRDGKVSSNGNNAIQDQGVDNEQSENSQNSIEQSQPATVNLLQADNIINDEEHQHGHNSNLQDLWRQAVSSDGNISIRQNQVETRPVNMDEDFAAFEDWAYKEHQQSTSNQCNVPIQLDPKLVVNLIPNSNSNIRKEYLTQPSRVINNCANMANEGQPHNNERDPANVSEPMHEQHIAQINDDGQQQFHQNESELLDIFKSIHTLQQLFERFQQENRAVNRNISQAPMNNAENSDDSDNLNESNANRSSLENITNQNANEVIGLRDPYDFATPSTSGCARLGMIAGNRSQTDPGIPIKFSRIKRAQIRRASAQSSVNDDLIGGGDHIPLNLLRRINWTSFSTATRQLLTAVFPRRVLATHSLTGKPARMFPDKPTKKRLNPKLVDDIVRTVSERCGVTERQVRHIITLKCNQETRFYRKEQESSRARDGDDNDESSDTEVSP